MLYVVSSLQFSLTDKPRYLQYLVFFNFYRLEAIYQLVIGGISILELPAE